ncbi:hypothetical protein [Azotosporobacter soli]|uniref:hypothetical protein n=1 Tax=Azotosporobacter soli TaxID=3055040 RepID=UPI0031FF0402
MGAQVSVESGVGIVYGTHHFSATLAQGFVEWLCSIEHPYGRWFCFPPGSCEFSIVWLELAEQQYEEFSDLQDQYYGLLS